MIKIGLISRLLSQSTDYYETVAELCRVHLSVAIWQLYDNKLNDYVGMYFTDYSKDLSDYRSPESEVTYREVIEWAKGTSRVVHKYLQSSAGKHYFLSSFIKQLNANDKLPPVNRRASTYPLKRKGIRPGFHVDDSAPSSSLSCWRVIAIV